jgi:hypothetical protein
MPLLRLFTCTTIYLLLLVSGQLYAQKSALVSNLEAGLEAGAYMSTNDDTPFWLRTNRFGVVPNQAPSGVLQGYFRRNYLFYDSLSNRPKKLDWRVAVNPYLTYTKGGRYRLVLPEANASVRFKMTELYIGRRKEVMGLGDTTLSSGFYSGSGNALPVPKIQIGTIGFTPLKFTRNFLAIHAGFAHAWFHTDYLDGVRLHQKFLYFRLGKPASVNKFYLGLNHNVMWAGHGEYLKQNPDLALDGELPSSWKFFPNVVLAYTSKNWYKKNGYSSFDSYRLGNHLGSYDFGFETKAGDYKLFIYHQHPFEDVSSMLFKNVPDGLYGVNFKLKNTSKRTGVLLTNITAEFLTTKDQSGSQFFITGSKFQGADNYFNHSQYKEGWSYRGRPIGTPFIIPGKDMDPTKQGNGRYYPNNRVNMWYLGAQGRVGEALSLTLRTSYSRNFGTPGADYNPVRGQFSSLLGAEYRLAFLGNVSVTAQWAMDRGDIFTKNNGGFIGLKKAW